MPRLGGNHYRAMFRFSVPKDHAVIRVNLTPDFMPSARHEIGGSCGDAELPSFWCVCRTTAGATENEASCYLNRGALKPMAVRLRERLIAGVLYPPCRSLVSPLYKTKHGDSIRAFQ